MNFWDKHYKERVNLTSNRCYQVGKTIDGRPVGKDQVDLIVRTISERLNLSKNDHIIDIGCGNGLLSEQLISRVSHITAMDRSEQLLSVAREKISHGNLDFIKCSIGDEIFARALRRSSATKAFLYEVVQLLTSTEVDVLLRLISSSTVETVYMGGIPDRLKLGDYYDTPEKLEFFLDSEKKGKPHMGKWWTFDELYETCLLNGFSAIRLPQDQSLYTSYYRFDLIVERMS